LYRLDIVVVASQLRTAIHNIDASHWEECFCSWKKLQSVVPRPHFGAQCSRSDGSCQLSLNDTSTVDRSQCQVGSKSAVKRPSAELVSFRVSAKCAGRTLSFNSQVGVISYQSLQLVIIENFEITYETYYCYYFHCMEQTGSLCCLTRTLFNLFHPQEAVKYCSQLVCLYHVFQCFDAVGWAAGRAFGL